jgi:nucleotide-binding universal stress UspA family protein
MPAPIIAAFEPYTDDRAPVELALAAGDLTGAPVVAVAVHPWPIREDDDDPEPLYAESRQIVVEAVERLRAELGVDTRLVQQMSVPRALDAFAREHEAGLVVVGSTRRGRAERVLLGSSAERLLQGAPCAVALAPRGYTRSALQTIAVGFVDSPEGHAALVTAHALAARQGAQLRVVAAVHPTGGFDSAAGKPERGHRLQGRHRLEAQAALDQALAALPAGAQAEGELHVDDPAEVLLRISENVDLLVCGSRGYGPLRSVLLGGVSRRLVDGAHCPVLVLPRGVEHPLEDLGLAITAAAQ